MKVLVVDTTPAEREVTTRALSAAEHEVETAGSLAEASAALGRDRRDVVVIECTMSDGAALDLIRRIRATSTERAGTGTRA